MPFFDRGFNRFSILYFESFKDILNISLLRQAKDSLWIVSHYFNSKYKTYFTYVFY